MKGRNLFHGNMVSEKFNTVFRVTITPHLNIHDNILTKERVRRIYIKSSKGKFEGLRISEGFEKEIDSLLGGQQHVLRRARAIVARRFT